MSTSTEKAVIFRKKIFLRRPDLQQRHGGASAEERAVCLNETFFTGSQSRSSHLTNQKPEQWSAF